MKNHKKILLLLIGICICMLLFLTVQIYAKYLTTASANSSISIASWNIKVNDLAITSNTDISASIVPVFPGTENIAKDIIAPTAEGYFDLNLDFSDTDVSFEYEIITSVAENSSVQDLVATGYSIDGGEKIDFENYNDPITEIVKLSDSLENRNIRIYIMWDDNVDSQTMDNDADTLSTSSETPALFNVNILFTQIADS